MPPALQSSSALLPHLLSALGTMPLGVAAFDRDLCCLYANEALARLMGVPAKSLVGRAVDDVLPGSSDGLLRNLRAVVETGAPILGQLVHHERGGQSSDGGRWRLDVQPTRDAAGDVVGVTVLVADLTAQGAPEAARREHEQDLRLAIETARMGTWSLDLRTGEFRGSPRAREIYGLAPGHELTMRGLAELVHPDDRATVAEAATQSTRNGEMYEKRYRIVRPDGEIRWVVISGRTIPGEDGQPARAVGVSLDVTDRHAAELGLSEREAMLASVLAASPDLITVSDVDGVTQTASPSMREVLGFDPGERVGFRLTDRVHPDDAAQVRAAAARAFVSGAVERVRHRYLHRDGRWRVLDSWGRAVHERDGTPRHLVAISRDVTAAVEAEEERTRLLEAERAARALAEEASHAKSAFLAMMSHEIRTPLNGVIGMTSLLLDGELDPEQREYAATIRGSGEALLQIINDILDFSKIEAGRIELEHAACDPRAIVEDVVALLAGQAAERQVELAVVVDVPDSDRFLGDAGRVRQVLLNLVGNALKFTEAGGAVTIRVRPEADGDEAATSGAGDARDGSGAQVRADGSVAEAGTGQAVIRFAVQDTGIGIPAEVVPRLFQPFVQADGSTTRSYGGTGLGLAISKRLTTMLGGDIGVQSEVGVGSTFWFTLRLERDRAAEGLPALPVHAIDGRRVLLVSDRATSRQMLREQLEAWGVFVRTASSGSVADLLESVRGAAGSLADPTGSVRGANAVSARSDGEPLAVGLLDAGGGTTPYDLLVLDLVTPDDVTLARLAAIRSDPDLAGLPVLLVAGPGQRTGDAPMDAAQVYLTRPVRPSQLRDALAMLLFGAVPAVPDPPEPFGDWPARGASVGVAARILVAEDNVVNQKVAGRMLERLGYRVDVVANGHEAIQALRQVPYAAVLMDCQMPEMDGYEATASIRRSERGSRHTPIIAMTASAMLGDREQCLAAGMDDYVAKPVRPDELATVLERWVTTGRRRQ